MAVSYNQPINTLLTEEEEADEEDEGRRFYRRF